MVNLTESDIQTTKEGFLKIYEWHRSKHLTIQEAYYRTLDYCKTNNITPLYSTLESFKVSALYLKK